MSNNLNKNSDIFQDAFQNGFRKETSGLSHNYRDHINRLRNGDENGQIPHSKLKDYDPMKVDSNLFNTDHKDQKEPYEVSGGAGSGSDRAGGWNPGDNLDSGGDGQRGGPGEAGSPDANKQLSFATNLKQFGKASGRSGRDVVQEVLTARNAEGHLMGVPGVPSPPQNVGGGVEGVRRTHEGFEGSGKISKKIGLSSQPPPLS